MLQTGHGKAGLALFLCLYGIVPMLYLFRASRNLLHRSSRNDNTEQAAARDNSTDTREKSALVNVDSTSTTRSAGNHTPPPSSRRRVPSWAGHALWYKSRTREPRASSDTESTASVAGQTRMFEVINRHQRIRRQSTNTNSRASRPLGDLDLLERRRSLNAVVGLFPMSIVIFIERSLQGELDYALSQNSRTQGTTPATVDMQSQLALMTTVADPLSQAEMPHLFDAILGIVSHLALLALCVLSLVALWFLTSRVGFAVFLIWTLAFYIILSLCAWYGRPSKSILTVLISRLHASPSPAPPRPTPSPLPLSIDQYSFPTDARGPYVHHQPPFRVAGTDEISTSHGVLRSPEDDDDEDDADEDVRQQRIEDEMARRDVSIITVPRKKLWITNPESGDS